MTTALVSCGGDSGNSPSPTPITQEQQVNFGFTMVKDEWYDCSIAVQGNPNRTITLFINNQNVGSLTMSSPVKDESFSMIVEPGQYQYRATGANWKNEPLEWSGTVLANYPMGATIYLQCE